MVQLLMEPEDVCVLCHPHCTFLASPLWMKVRGQAPGLRGGLRLTSVPGTFTPARSAGGSSTALATWSGISSSTRVGVPAGRRGLGLVHGCPGSHASYCVRLLPAGFCSPSQQGPSLPITPSGSSGPAPHHRAQGKVPPRWREGVAPLSPGFQL